MEKEKVLVGDNKGVFFKTLQEELQFEENYLLYNETEQKEINCYIKVVYTRFGLLEFLKLNKNIPNVLVFLFNEKLNGSLAFLEEITSLIKLDGHKTRKEIIQDLKVHLKKIAVYKSNVLKSAFSNSLAYQTQFNDSYKALFIFA